MLRGILSVLQVKSRLMVALLCAVAFAVVIPAPASATQVFVTTTADKVDGDISSCAALDLFKGADGAVSLREAILALRGETLPAEIILTPATYALESPDTTVSVGLMPEILGGSLDVTSVPGVSVKITGAGATIMPKVGLPSHDRLFDLDAAFSGGLMFELDDVTLTQGWAQGPVGGGAIRAGGTADSVPPTVLTLRRCTITNNRADRSATPASSGGALNLGTNVRFTVEDCSFAGNTAAGVGGAVFIADSGSGSLNINRCTFNSNTADGTSVSAGQGGAIYARVGAGGGTVTKSVFTSNTAVSLGNAGPDRGGAMFVGGSVEIHDNRIVGNVADEASGIYGFLGTPHAEYNWWGVQDDASFTTATRLANVTYSPWLKLTLQSNPTTIAISSASSLTVSFVTNGHWAPADATPVTVAAGTWGTMAPSTMTLSSGTASSRFTAAAVPGRCIAQAAYDSAVATAVVDITRGPLVGLSREVTFTVGSNDSWPIEATGFPAPAISVTGSLPAGVVFTNGGSVTQTRSVATIAGNPEQGTGGYWPVTVMATNGISPGASIPATITVVETPRFVSSAAVTFTAGVSRSFDVTTTGFPVSAIAAQSSLPSGVTLVDNGDGTARLSGTAVAGSGGSSTYTIEASNGIADVYQTLRIAIVEPPRFTSAESVGFAEGVLGSFSITATGYPAPRVNLLSLLPSGLSVVNHADGSAELTGTPAAGTGGRHFIRFQAVNAAGSVDQTLTLDIGGVPVGVVDGAACPEDSNAVLNVLANDIDPNPGDVLSAQLEAGPSHGSVTLSPSGIATYTPEPDFYGTDSFTYRAHGSGPFSAFVSDATSVTISVSRVNDAPSFVKGADVVVDEDSGRYWQIWSPSVKAGPPNEAGQALSVLSQCSNGALFSGMPFMNDFGVLDFTPAPNANGSAVVTITITDDGSQGAPARLSHTETLTITIRPVNDAPTFTGSGDVTVAEDSGHFSAAWLRSILPGPVDELGQQVEVGTSCSNPDLFSSAPAVASDGTLEFTPAPDANGSAVVTLTVTDDGVPAASAQTSFRITVTPVNDAPSFTNGGEVVVDEDSGDYSGVWAGALTPGPVDESGQTMSMATANSAPELFDVQPSVSSAGRLSFRPKADANGSVDVTVTATDDGTPALSRTQTFTIEITPVNDVPTIVSGGDVAVDEDSGDYSSAWGRGITPGPVNESGQTLSFATECSDPSIFSAPPVMLADGTLEFSTKADANGSAEVTVTVTDDGDPNASSVATCVVTVRAVNDRPVATDDAATVAEDETLTVGATGVLANDRDVESTVLTASVEVAPMGSLTLRPDGSFTYRAPQDFNGTDSFTYRASDGETLSAPATVTIEVTPVNDAPTLDGGGAVTVAEDCGPQAMRWASRIDAGAPSESAQALSIQTVCSSYALFSARPRVSLDGTLTFTPAADANGSADVTVTVTDDATAGGPARSTVATFTITITPMPDAPVAVGDSESAFEDAALLVPAPGVLGNDRDADGDLLSARLISGVAHGTLSLYADGSFAYTPTAGWSGSDSFTYVANDGTTDSSPATVLLTVASVNDAPVSHDDTATVSEDGTLTVAAPGVLANDSDPDGDALSAVLVEAPAHGALRLSANGSYVYTPERDFNGIDRFVYRASDGSSVSGTSSVTIDVASVPENVMFKLTSRSATLSAYGKKYTLSGALFSNDASMPLARVRLQTALPGAPFKFASAQTTTSADGTFRFVVAPSVRTRYRAVFEAVGDYLSTASAEVTVTPRAYVSIPSAPKSVKKGVTFRATGTVKVSYRSTNPRVRIELWRYSNRRWASVGHVHAIMKKSGAATVYSASIRIKRTGAYRMRAYYPADLAHASSWSSGYKKISVK